MWKRKTLNLFKLKLIIMIIADCCFASSTQCRDLFFTQNSPPQIFSKNSPSEMSLYFIMPRLFGDKKFSSITKELPKLKKMGINTLWISPVQPQTEAGPPLFAKNNHGYWPKNFHEIDPQLGGEKEFIELIQTARKMGIEICLDAVLNHFGYADFIEMNGKRVSTKDPHYFIIPLAQNENYHVREQYLWSRMEVSSDIKELRELKQESEDYPLYNLPTLNWKNPEVFRYIVESYKKFIDRGVFAFRMDAAKHIPSDQLIQLQNELSDYAQTKGSKLKFIWEFFVANSESLSLYAEDTITKLKDKQSTYFFDFPLMKEFRRLEEENYRFAWLTEFVKYRSKKPLMRSRYIPLVEDHDSGIPIRDPYRALLIYAATEFFSPNPSMLYQGTEKAGIAQTTRNHVSAINSSGDTGNLLKLMRKTLAPYRIEPSEFVFHRADQDILSAEIKKNTSSLYLFSNKGAQETTLEIPVDTLGSLKEIAKFNEVKINVSSLPSKKIKITLPPYSFLVLENEKH